MTLECELKYLDADLAELSNRLKAAGGECLGRYFESNIVFDLPDRSLKAAGVLLRLREKQGKAVLTVKRPPEKPIPSALKVFEEIESGVDDFDAVKGALEVLGFVVAFSYEKVREKWRFMECAVCLDHLPFGDYAEIEGTEATVPVCAVKLGLDSNATTKKTYHALNIEYRSEKGLPSEESFVFSEDEKHRIQNDLEKE